MFVPTKVTTVNMSNQNFSELKPTSSSAMDGPGAELPPEVKLNIFDLNK